MKHFLTVILLIISNYHIFSQSIKAEWTALEQRPYPQWFSDAKLGIFIHWGLYSVPAYASKEGYAEWYLRGLMVGDTNRIHFQNRVFGTGNEDFQYADFTRYWKGELFRPAEWAQLFRRAGARYVVLVTKHHDGYCLWDSEFQPNWNSVVSGPKRNIVAEVTEAVRREGLQMGFYYSLLEWNNPLHRWTVDPHDSVNNYVEQYMMPQFKELVNRYRPTLIFSDGDWDNTAAQLHSAELISWYYNLIGEEAIVNNRWGSDNPHGFRTPEYSAGITLTDRPWAECRGLGRSFGLNRNEPIENYLTSDELIRHFVKLVAAGGGLTLNVGPAADGQIPLLQQERLLDLGKWLEINGDAIYGSRPYTRFYEMKDVEIQRIDTQISFNWKRNAPDAAIAYDHFTAEWNGTIQAPVSDEFTFEIETDDATTVVINGKTIIQYDPTQEKSSKIGKIKLHAGQKNTITVQFTEEDLEAVAILHWSARSLPKEVVPATAFGNGLNARYSCQQPTICYTTKDKTLYAIALDYPQDGLELPLPNLKQTPTVTLLGCTKVLPTNYQNGKLFIDTRPLQYADLTSTAAWTFKISIE